jgi:hypothetical protein
VQHNTIVKDLRNIKFKFLFKIQKVVLNNKLNVLVPINKGQGLGWAK